MPLWWILVFILTVENRASGVRIEVDVKDYESKYKGTSLELGDCPTREVLDEKGLPWIKTCKAKMKGDMVTLPTSQYEVVSKQLHSNQDLTKYVMGGAGVGIGAFGLLSVSVKVNVAVTTQTNSKQITLASTYTVSRGSLSLRGARNPSGAPGEFYLSEIQLGATETLLVTMEFESEKKKTQIDGAVEIKILFISIRKKVQKIIESFGASASAKVVLLSSWREPRNESFVGTHALSNIDNVLEKLEADFLRGPEEVLKKPIGDPSLRKTFVFTSLNSSSPENTLNEALSRRHMDLLTQQQCELTTVHYKIDVYLGAREFRNLIPKDKKDDLNDFLKEVKDKRGRLEEALMTFYQMDAKKRATLRDIYGKDRAPGYYLRKLDRIYKPREGISFMDAELQLAEQRARAAGRTLGEQVLHHSVPEL